MPNGIIAILDPSGGNPPHTFSDTRVGATPSCIVIGCRLEMDGETEIAVGLASEMEPKAFLIFDDTLETPSRAVEVATVHADILVRMPASDVKTRIRVWANEEREASQITIGLE